MRESDGRWRSGKAAQTIAPLTSTTAIAATTTSAKGDRTAREAMDAAASDSPTTADAARAARTMA